MSGSSPAEPVVSVIMPVRNGERFLSDAIRSILDQTLSDFELIVVDDGSTDASADIAAHFEDPRVTVINQEPLGVGCARNSGLAVARGRFIAFMDGDDLAAPERLATQVDFLREHPHVGVVGTWTEHIDSEGNPTTLPPQRPPCDDASIRLEMLDDSGFFCTSILCRREAIQALRFRDDLAYAEDYELTLRLIHRTQAANIPRCLYLYRRHETSATAKLDDTAKRSSRESIRASVVQTLMQPLQDPAGGTTSAVDPGANLYDEALMRRTAYSWFLRAAATRRYRLSATFLALAFRRGSSPRGGGMTGGFRSALAVHSQLGLRRSLAGVVRKGPNLHFELRGRG